METKITRREFLKLMALTSLSYALPKNIPAESKLGQNDDRENLLVIVFDAWSASNISLLGYPRQTTPHIDRLTNRAVVYHNHFTGGHFTPPGTASLLTGTQSWTHRAFDYEPSLDQDLLQKNIFHAFGEYYRFAYSHNPLVHHLLRQFLEDLNDLLRWEKLYFAYDRLAPLFRNDQDIASVSWNRAMMPSEDGYAYSLFISQVYEKLKENKYAPHVSLFPRGIPNHDNRAYFTLEHGIDHLFELTQTVSGPFLGYYHFFPPHGDYNTRKDFYTQFRKDDYLPPPKPLQIFKDSPDEYLNIQRQFYDEFILYVDAEFARLYQQLERSGTLENTWIILTSDHGEMFERGIEGHTSPVFYQPISHIPLVIFPPGQKERIDVYDNTRAEDVLPTLLKFTGQEVPSWAEGAVLPPFGPPDSIQGRDITTVQVENVEDGKIKAASAVCIRENYKAMWLFGYEGMQAGDEIIELYNIESDPEEIHNLYPVQKEIADEMVGVLRTKMAQLEETYR